MKLVFFGTSEFAVPILQNLIEHKFEVVVVTSPDALVGRKQLLTPSPIGAFAQNNNLTVHKPKFLKNNLDFLETLKNSKAELFVVAAYGKIIPNNILSLPLLGSLNVHPSLLPKYRGPSPIQYALLNGDSETGTTIMQMDSEVDHGPIFAQTILPIDSNDNFKTLADKLAKSSSMLLEDTIEKIKKDSIKPQEQDHTKATFTKIIAKEDGKINWNSSSTKIYNQFRAYSNWPGVWTTLDGTVLKITNCLAQSTQSEALPGTILPDGHVQCLDGQLEIISLQLAGKTETDIKSFLNGHPKIVGQKLN
jgi:methionyl-tRNA formyltransferase